MRPANGSSVELRELDRDNFDAVIGLQVGSDQRDFLNSNVETIAWAYVAEESSPLVIYAGDAPVGLVAYGYVASTGMSWIIHLMVDESSQRRGIGRAALDLLIERMYAVSGGQPVVVAVHPDNTAALRLYETAGFSDTGKRQDGEMILRLPGPGRLA